MFLLFPRRKESLIKKKGQPLLTDIEQGRVSEIDMTKIMDCIYFRVEKEMFGELFPKRLQIWEHIKSCPDELHTLVNSVNEYLQLYKTCASVAAKDSELFLRWLDVMGSLTCEEKQTDVTKTTTQLVCGIPGDKETHGCNCFECRSLGNKPTNVKFIRKNLIISP